MGGDEWLLEAYRLLEKARGLSGEEKRVLNYFLENLSVGIIRAVEELKRYVRDPLEVIERLAEQGFLEKKTDCINLAAPLRAYVVRRGPLRV